MKCFSGIWARLNRQAGNWQTLCLQTTCWLCLLCGGVLFSTEANAAGTEFTMSGSDLIIDVNSKWVGCRDGGYYPLRIRVRNIGPARAITLDFHSDPSTQPIPVVSREITIEQNAVLNTTLLIPLVDHGSYGQLSVLSNGRQLKNLSQSVTLADTTNTYERGPAMLIVSPRREDPLFYNRAVVHNSSSTRHGYSHTSEYTESIQPSSLPDHWLAYSGLDLLAIPLATFEKDIPAETRQAILQWVETGGNLLVYDGAERISVLEKLLDLPRRKFVEANWTAADSQQFRQINVINPSDESLSGPENLDEGSAWPNKNDTFQRRTVGLGTVTFFKENPFPGTSSHWTWFLKSLPENQLLWKQRHGIMARKSNPSFLQFLIPSVGGVPIMSFLILITLFTIVIGPLNYGYFLRRKKLAMLLITVPLLACGSSLLLVGYSTVAHGFSVKSRVRSITFLDQGRNSSLSLSRVSYYAGMAPSGGLNFEPSTAVYPIWATESAFESGRVNWSDTQHFQNGWLRSRTRTQFLTVSSQEQRGRLTLTEENTTKPKLSNGLEWGLQKLLIKDHQGRVWFAEQIKPGAVVALVPAEKEHYAQFRDLINDNALELPDGMDPNAAMQVTAYSNQFSYMGDEESDHLNTYAQSLQEQNFLAVKKLSETNNWLKPRSYTAVFDQNPDLDLGLNRTREQLSLHLLVGYLE